jgi:hypothetical protein
MNEIIVEPRTVYGNTNIYPKCEKAKLFAKLVDQKTLTQDNLDIIKQLGYSIRAQYVEVNL